MSDHFREKHLPKASVGSNSNSYAIFVKKSSHATSSNSSILFRYYIYGQNQQN